MNNTNNLIEMKSVKSVRRCFWMLILILIFSSFRVSDVVAQATSDESKWTYTVFGNFGCNVFLNFRTKQTFPGIRVFGALSIQGVHKNGVLIHYGPSLSIYSKTIGANLNPLVGDIQIDFTNTFSGGYVWGGSTEYIKQLRTLHNGDFFNLVHNEKYAIVISTNFILNNHKRNQLIGAASITIDDVSINYNNDAIPFNVIGLSDGFDRYWTGGATIFWHNHNEYNNLEFSYDQFTGYQPKLYELANILGTNVPQYTSRADKSIPTNYNTSIYHVKIGIDRSTSVDFGTVGAMTYKQRYYGFQDIIHLIGKFSFHPNQDQTGVFIGGSFNRNEKLN
jgi:hypothetical protein